MLIFCWKWTAEICGFLGHQNIDSWDSSKSEGTISDTGGGGGGGGGGP